MKVIMFGQTSEIGSFLNTSDLSRYNIYCKECNNLSITQID